VTESIEDTRHVIHPSRNKKPVSDQGAPEFISRKSMLQFFNLKSKIAQSIDAFLGRAKASLGSEFMAFRVLL